MKVRVIKNGLRYLCGFRINIIVILLGFFKDDAEAAAFSGQVRENFAEWNKTHNEPYVLSTSIGYAPYQNGQNLNDLLGIADEKLYVEKRARKVGR